MKRLFHLLTVLFIIAISSVDAYANEKMSKLQAFMDSPANSRAADELIVDLAEWGDEPVIEPLYARVSGRRYIFKNGTLQCAQGYNGHILEISEGCTVLLQDGCKILPSSELNDEQIRSAEDLIYIENGNLATAYTVTVGPESIEDENAPFYPVIGTVADYDVNSKKIEIDGGLINGAITTRSCSASIFANGGRLRKISIEFPKLQYIYLDLTNCVIDNYTCPLSDVYVVPEFDIPGPMTHQMNITTADDKIGESFKILSYSGRTSFYPDGFDGILKNVKVQNLNYPDVEWILSYDGHDYDVIATKKEEPISSAEWLQTQINNIANTESRSGVIEVPQQYQTLEKPVYFPNGVDITLSGTIYPIFEANSITPQVFFINPGASLSMQGKVDFSENINFTGDVFVNDQGTLILDETFVAVFPEQVVEGSIIKSVGGKNVINSGFNTSKKLLVATADSKTEGRSTLEVNDGKFYYRTNSSPFISGPVDVTMSGGYFYCNNECMLFIELDGIFNLYGGDISGNYKEGSVVVSATETNYRTGNITGYSTFACGGSLGISANDIAREPDLDPGNLSIPTGKKFIYMYKLSNTIIKGDVAIGGANFDSQYENKLILDTDLNPYIHVTSAPKYNWRIKASDWHALELDKNFISGNGDNKLNEVILDGIIKYNLTQEDFDKMEFIDVPDDLTIYFEPNPSETQSAGIRIRKKVTGSKSLQDFLDQKRTDEEKGTEENPIAIPIDNDINVDEDVTFKDLQAYLDGSSTNSNTGEKQRRTISFTGGNFIIDHDACISFRDIYLDGCDGNNTIYVYGKLIIDVDVYIYGFTEQFIHVMPGGKVEWRGGEAKGYIKNDGGEVNVYQGKFEADGDGYCILNISGTFIIHGGDFNGGSNGAIWNETSGTMIIYGGQITDGFVNRGKLIIYYVYIHCVHHCGIYNEGGDVTMEGGEINDSEDYPGIDTDRDIIMCGCVVITRIHLRRGAVIHFTSELTVNIHIHVVINGSERFMIAKGYDYILTLDDLARLILEAIDGYVLSLDSEDQNIYVEKQSESVFDIVNIEDVDSIDGDTPVYNLQGFALCTWQERNSLPTGVYIVDGNKIKL